jgi:hypothetical protein
MSENRIRDEESKEDTGTRGGGGGHFWLVVAFTCVPVVLDPVVVQWEHRGVLDI